MKKQTVINFRIEVMVIFLILFSTFVLNAQTQGIEPYANNPNYWQYKGEPVLLIGGSSSDNLFQNDNFVDELNAIHACGGNYIYCSLSGRDVGDEWPFWRNARWYNLNKFNPDYWKKLDDFLRFTAERNIFVQLEVWDFYDFFGAWGRNPWNPLNNNVLTTQNSRLKTESFTDIKTAENNFFFSVPRLNNDSILLSYQKNFVDQLLSISLKYSHVLYCVNNKATKGYAPEWGRYWAEYIQNKAKEEGVKAQVCELLQDSYLENKIDLHAQSSKLFSFYEISNNLNEVGQNHWEKLKQFRESFKNNPCPLNNVRIYGGPFGDWTGGPEHGIRRFWQNLIGGVAAIRFHRLPLGLGFNSRALAQIKSAKLLSENYNFFSSSPDADFSLIKNRDSNEAYLASNKQADLIVYFPDGGDIKVDLTGFPGIYKIKWLNIEGSNWYSEEEITGGNIIRIKSPFSGGWLALLKKERVE